MIKYLIFLILFFLMFRIDEEWEIYKQGIKTDCNERIDMNV